MITLELPLLVAGVATLIALVALIWVIVQAFKLRQLRTTVMGMERLLALNTEFYQGLSAGALGHGKHLARVRQDLMQLKDRIEQVAVTDPSGAAFNQAIRMARKGCTAEEIMEACGISRVEADLVVVLHRSEEEG